MQITPNNFKEQYMQKELSKTIGYNKEELTFSEFIDSPSTQELIYHTLRINAPVKDAKRLVLSTFETLDENKLK